MAFTQDNRLQAWSELTSIELTESLVFHELTDDSWTAEAQMAEVVNIQRPTSYGAEASTPARGADWGTAQEPSALRIQMSINNPVRTEGALQVIDELENPVKDYRDRMGQSAGAELAGKVEGGVITYLNGLSADQSGDAAAKAARNGNAGPITAPAALGTAANSFARSTGKPKNDTARDLVAGALDDAAVAFRRAHVQAYGTAIGGEPGSIWAVMHPELFTFGLRASLLDMGIDIGAEASTQAIREMGVFSDMAFAGRYSGIDVLTSERLKLPTGAENFVFYCGTNKAVALAVRDVRSYVTEPQNARKEQYEFRQQTEYGVHLVNSQLLRRVTITAS